MVGVIIPIKYKFEWGLVCDAYSLLMAYYKVHTALMWKVTCSVFRLLVICCVWILFSRGNYTNFIPLFIYYFCRMWLCVILIFFGFYNFTAKSAGIPFLSPFLDGDAVARGHGVNFAVLDATALPVNVLTANSIPLPLHFSSLSEQLDWMSTYFNDTFHNQDG